MIKANSQMPLTKPLDAILFDCDGTLSTIEGIDVLADGKGVAAAVHALTNEAMSYTGVHAGMYQQRLDLVRPTRMQVEQLSKTYYKHCTPDVPAVIAILQRLKKSVFVVSAGLYPAVSGFAGMLNVAPSHVYAVDIDFDEQGNYQSFDNDSPLIDRSGKRIIVKELAAAYPHLALIGDGMNDFIAHDVVTRFIGFGGIYYRQNIAEQCDFYIKTPSMAAVLPLILTEEEIESLLPEERALYDQMALI